MIREDSFLSFYQLENIHQKNKEKNENIFSHHD